MISKAQTAKPIPQILHFFSGLRPRTPVYDIIDHRGLLISQNFRPAAGSEKISFGAYGDHWFEVHLDNSYSLPIVSSVKAKFTPILASNYRKK